jgi:hypothetical protein
MGIKFKLDDFVEKMRNDPMSVNMKEIIESRIVELADALHDMIRDGEKIPYNHISIISDAMNKAGDLCNVYLLVMQCTGKQNEIPEDVINAIKFIHTFDNDKIMSILDDESKHMIETMKKFDNLFGKN